MQLEKPLTRTDSKLFSHPHAVAAVTDGGQLVGLNDRIPESTESNTLKPVNPDDPFFLEIVMHSATFVLGYATNRILSSKAIGVRHGFCLEDSPLNCGFYVDAIDGSITDDEFDKISREFQKVISEDIPIVPVEYEEAVVLEKLKKQGSNISYHLLKSKSISPTCRCYEIDNYITLRRVPLAPSSKLFEFGQKVRLVKEGRGMIIRLDTMAAVPRSTSIDEAFERAINWGNATRTGSIGEINEKVLNKPEPFILLEELRFDNEIVACASTAFKGHPNLKVVLISGPSASGKTTFAHKLALAFRGMGKQPTVMSTDDYYKDTSDPDYPKQPNGQLDHEVIEALRLDVLKRDLSDLMAGKSIEAPIFDFVTQKPSKHGRPLKLGSDGILIMEGIFTLDPKISDGMDTKGLFTIFISPMPFSFLDEQSFITNSNYRLIRRIARDYLHRGRDAAASIKRLTSVNRGEYNAILPHIGNANYFFNSAMAHELPVLSILTVPLLRLVQPTDEVYPHATQLLDTLQHVNSCSDKFLNNASLLREFVGGSVFEEEPKKMDSEQKPVSEDLATLGTLVVPHPTPTTVLEALKRTIPSIKETDIVGAYLDGEVVPLSQIVSVLDKSDEMYIRPLERSCKSARALMRATAAFMLHVAVRHLWPTRRIVFTHFGAESGDISKAYLGRVYEKTSDEKQELLVKLTDSDIMALEKEMTRMVEAGAPLQAKKISVTAAMRYFANAGMYYSASLLRSRNIPTVEVITCEGEMALDMQPLAPNAGCLSEPNAYALYHHEKGLTLAFGMGHGTPSSPSVPERPVMSAVRQDILEVADFVRHATRIRCVGDMNNAVFEQQSGDVADVYQATDHRRLSSLTELIKNKKDIKLILITGSSITGKTTFTSKLVVHLRGAGVETREFSLEAYYKEITDPTFPKREQDNKNDFRSIEALDHQALQRDLDRILHGESISVPSYDVEKGMKDKKKMINVKGVPPQGGIVIIESIFGLHPALLTHIPRSEKLLVVEHPTSIINVDELRFVSHNVLRQLRHIVRGFQCRKRDARESLTRWDELNEYEERNLMPYLDSADVMFNASSPYEIGALKATVLPLLERVSPSFPAEYAAALQLRGLLAWYHDVPDMRLPPNSSIQTLMYGAAATD